MATRTKVLAPGSATCECTACGELFRSLAGFDKHRVFDNPAVEDWDTRRCMTAEEMREAGMSLNSKGQWITQAWDSRNTEWAVA